MNINWRTAIGVRGVERDRRYYSVSLFSLESRSREEPFHTFAVLNSLPVHAIIQKKLCDEILFDVFS